MASVRPRLPDSDRLPHRPLPSALGLRAFDGYPYLSIRVVPTLYHMVVLPRTLSRDMLGTIARTQRDANRLPVCLVLGESHSVYCDPEGGSYESADLPRGGHVLTGRLELGTSLGKSADVLARCDRLIAFIEAQAHQGFLVCSGSAGLRRATPEERDTLTGLTADGVPRGLARCPHCRDWHGTTLLPDTDKVVRAYCRCENWNRCARCGGPLGERRLNAHHYDPRDGKFWHTPGFCGLSHRCADACPHLGGPGA